MTDFTFDWSELAFASKKPLSSLKAIFIGAPRSMSSARFTQLIKELLPQGPIILGLAKEDYITGFEGQPQFTTLSRQDVSVIIDKVNHSSSKNKIYTLSYLQPELPYIIEKLDVARAIFINGSWLHSFHTTPTYYALMNKKVNYRLISPFVDEAEALAYEKTLTKKITLTFSKQIMNDTEIMTCASQVAKQSFDYSFQTGAVLAKKMSDGYIITGSGFNKVLPYQTYAMHHGASRETNFSPVNDLNHYDTIHAEMMVLIEALRNKTDLKGLSLFVNLMPCPNCARVLAETELDEIVYRIDHSEGYAVDLLQKMHKPIRRLV